MGSWKPTDVVDGGHKSERRHRPDTWDSHHVSTPRFPCSDFLQLLVRCYNLFVQRFDDRELSVDVHRHSFWPAEKFLFDPFGKGLNTSRTNLGKLRS